MLTDAGFDVVAHAGDADAVLRKALAHRPDVVVTDVQMPPGRGTTGCAAALELRRQRPETGVLVLSQYFEEHYALDLIGDRPEGVGYLLKERVGDVDAFVEAVARVAAGGSALDPEVVGRMLGRRRSGGAARRAEPARARRARRDGRGQVEPGHRRRARRHRGRGREARDAASSTSSASAARRPSTAACSPS